MGLLHKDLQDRNVVYDELIEHFKNKIADSGKNTANNKWLMETYDNEVIKADRGDAYLLEKLLACSFGGLSVGLLAGGIVLNELGLAFGLAGGALASAGISLQNYIKFKNLTLGRGLGTRMFYAETLQKIIEENNFKYPFNAGEMEDYAKVEDYVNFLKQFQSKDEEKRQNKDFI